MDRIIAMEDEDVALIRLSNDVKENDFVSSVCIQLGQNANNIKFDSFESVRWNEKKLQYSTSASAKVLEKGKEDIPNNCPLNIEKIFGEYGVVSTEFGPQWYLTGAGSSCGQSADRLFLTFMDDADINSIVDTLLDLSLK